MKVHRVQILLGNLLYFLVFSVFVSIDQVTKSSAMLQNLPTFTYNQGISFGVFSNLSYAILSSLIICTALIGYFFWRKAVAHAWQSHPYLVLLFAAGAVSNMVDRVVYGGVRDWLPVPGLGVYNNLADWYICIAVVVLIILELKKDTV